jgi:hypothetical protein
VVWRATGPVIAVPWDPDTVMASSTNEPT